jgi:hypothetical protein
MQTKYSLFIYLTVIACISLLKIRVGADATGLAPGVYKEGADGKFHAVTNVDLQALWPGIWKEDTNGLRVQLTLITNGNPTLVLIGVGSVRFNSLGGYLGAPGLVFPKCELQDTNGIAIPFLKGKSIEHSLPPRLSLNDFPRWPNGGLKSHVGFFTNGTPFMLTELNFSSLYKIPRESDYVLTVCTAIYKFGTNINYLDRVDLPCVTTKVHLVP